MSVDVVISLLIAIGPPALAWIRSARENFVFVIYSNINLYNKLYSSFENINVTYNGKIVEKNLYLLKGYVFYIGKKDIQQQNSKIYIESSADSTFLDFNVSSKPNGMNLNTSIEDNRAYSEFDLIKSKEYIHVQALVEMSASAIDITLEGKQDEFFSSKRQLDTNSFNLKYRIKDVEQGSVFKVNAYTQFKSDLIFSILAIVVAGLFIGFGAYVSSDIYSYSKKYSVGDQVISIDNYLDDKSKILYDNKRDSVEKIYFYNSLFMKELALDNFSLDVHNSIKKEINKILNRGVYGAYLRYIDAEKKLILANINSEEADKRILNYNITNSLIRKGDDLFKNVFVKNRNFLSIVFMGDSPKYKLDKNINIQFSAKGYYTIAITSCGILGLMIGLYGLTVSLVWYSKYGYIIKIIVAHQKEAKG